MLDASVFIDASKSDKFTDFIKELIKIECNLWTVPHVQFEFTRYASTIGEYNQFVTFIKDLGVVTLNRVEEMILEKSTLFTVALNKVQHGGKHMSYTDSILCTLCYYYRNSDAYLMTSNHNDIPMALFDRVDVITFEYGGIIRTEGLYKLSSKKLSAVLKKL